MLSFHVTIIWSMVPSKQAKKPVNLPTLHEHGRKLRELPGVMDALGKMSHCFGRDVPLDGITHLWSLFSQGLNAEDTVFIIETLIMESFGLDFDKFDLTLQPPQENHES